MPEGADTCGRAHVAPAGTRHLSYFVSVSTSQSSLSLPFFPNLTVAFLPGFASEAALNSLL